MNIKKKVYLTLMLAVALIFAFANINVEAGIDPGTGGSASNGKVSDWTVAYGEPVANGQVGDAWRALVKANKPRADKGTSLDDTFLKGDKWSITPPPGKSRQQFYEACRSSAYIWFYGKPDRFYFEIGTNAHPSIDKLPLPPLASLKDDASFYLQSYVSAGTPGWGKKGGAVVLCSNAMNPQPLENEVTFKADSGVFIYDGSPKTVTTYKVSGDIRAGDKVSVDTKAYGSRTEPGKHTGAVVFTNGPKIVAQDGTPTQNKYKIKAIPGDITILKKEENDPAGRCDFTGSDTVRGIVQNDVTVEDGYRPSGAPGVGFDKREYQNDAFFATQSLPSVGSPRTSWAPWKSRFLTGTQDLKTEKIDLSSRAKGFADYGGVINVLREHKYSQVDVTFCQPMKEVSTIEYDSNNEPYISTEWIKDGDEIIQSINLNDRRAGLDEYSYQILGVNCNLDGINRVKSNYGAKDFSLGGVASSLVQTPEKKGKQFPLGTGYTGTDGFYKPGTPGSTWTNSCKEAFGDACVVDKLPSPASNDADNNLGNTYLFTHLDDKVDGGYDYPSEKGELNIFRDNKEREIRADVWYPKVNKVDLKTFPGESPKRSTLKIFDKNQPVNGLNEPTPEIEVSHISPWGSADSINGIGIEKEYSGLVNRMDMRSQWASDDGKPYRLGLDWAYNAEAKNVGPGSLDGYKLLGTSGPFTYTFESHCTFKNEKGSYQANIPDEPFLTPGKIMPKWSDSGSVKTLFTRSVSKRSFEETKDDK